MPGVRRDRSHRFVAEYWCPNDDPEHKIVIDHKDACKTNNFYLNLEWVTYKENSKRAADMGLVKPGGNFSYIVETDVENRKSVIYLARQDIAEKYGTNVANIDAVLAGKTKSSQGKLFTFLDMSRQDILTLLGYLKPEEDFEENIIKLKEPREIDKDFEKWKENNKSEDKSN